MTEHETVVNMLDASSLRRGPGRPKGTTKPIPENNNQDENKEPEPEPEIKLRQVDVFELLYKAISKSKSSMLPEFPHNIGTVTLSPGVVIPVEVLADLQCRKFKVEEEQLGKLLMDYLRSIQNNYSHLMLTPKLQNDAMYYWERASTPLGTPDYLRFKSDPIGLCWNRLDFDLDFNGDEGLFTELFERFSHNRMAIRCFIGSLFDPKSYNEQFVVLRGEGGDGKSTLMSAIRRVFGEEGSLSIADPPGQDPHWGMSWLGKRIVTLADLDDPKALKKGVLRGLTGGEPSFIRPFYKPGYNLNLPARIMIGLNPSLDLEMTPATKRRLIYTEVSAPEKNGDSTYAERLWEYRAAFFGGCVRDYKTHYPNHGKIITEESSYELLREQKDETDIQNYRHWFNSFFEIGDHFKSSPDEVADAIQLRFANDPKGDFRRGAYAWLKRHGYEPKQKMEDGVRVRWYLRIKRRTILYTNPNSIPKN